MRCKISLGENQSGNRSGFDQNARNRVILRGTIAMAIEKEDRDE